MSAKLFLDFETRSLASLKDVGTYKYSRDPSTDILVLCYAIDGSPVKSWTPLDGPLPHALVSHVIGGGELWAHNICFEYYIWNNVGVPKYNFPKISTKQCHDTMALAYAMGLPPSLDKLGHALGVKNLKETKNVRIMHQLSRPRSVVGDEVTWWNDDDKFRLLVEYCKKDVEALREIAEHLKPLSDFERTVWELDQKINERGIGVDVVAVKQALDVVAIEKKTLNTKIEALTKGQVKTCTVNLQLTKFLQNEMRGIIDDFSGVSKIEVEKLLKNEKTPPLVREILEIKAEASKSSTAKLKKILDCEYEGRLRGLFQYAGTHTGRWAGRLVQLQNFPRASLLNKKQIDLFFHCLNLDKAHCLILNVLGPPLKVISDCLRGMVVPASNHQFLISDFSQIEAKILAWVAGERGLLDIFKRGEDVYKHAAASIFNVEIDKVTKDQRQLGKISILALGYGGGKGAFKQMAENYGVDVSSETAEKIKNAYREAYPKITTLWWSLDNAAKTAIRCKGVPTFVPNEFTSIRFIFEGGFLKCRLPSGREIHYFHPKIELKDTPWGMRETIFFQKYEFGKMRWVDTYGGKLCENVIQGIARDVLAYLMVELDKGGFDIVGHVHDEIIIEIPPHDDCLIQKFKKIMNMKPVWLTEIRVESSLDVEGRYKK